jgi:hypothetical protein
MEQQKYSGISHKYLACLHRLQGTNSLAYFPKASVVKKKTYLFSEKDIVSVECTLSSAETSQLEKKFSLKNARKTAYDILTVTLNIFEIIYNDTGLSHTLSIVLI